MGRLRYKHLALISMGWLLPVVVVTGVIFFAHTRIFAQTGPTVSDLQTAIQKNMLRIGEDTHKGYRQIYYIINNKRYYLTDNAINHTAPMLSGSRVVWLEEQGSARNVYVYDFLTNQKLQLTFTGSHQNPQIQGNIVVWERWIDESWQVEYYDGSKVTPVSKQYSSSRSRLSGDKIAYAQQLPNNQWRVNVYTISSGETTQEYQGPGKAAYPKFVDGELRLPLSRLK